MMGPARRLLATIFWAVRMSLFSLSSCFRKLLCVLRYPRLQKLYPLTDDDVMEHVGLLRARADLVAPVIVDPVVPSDSNDDPVIYTAVAGRADVLCAVDRDFYAPNVVMFCREQGIEIMNDVQLLQRLIPERQ